MMTGNEKTALRPMALYTAVYLLWFRLVEALPRSSYQVIELAESRGIHVPGDLSVVGIDDAYLAPMSRTPLTSFPHPKEGLGKKAAENLLRMIEEPGFDGNYLFDSEPVIRESVAVLN